MRLVAVAVTNGILSRQQVPSACAPFVARYDAVDAMDQTLESYCSIDSIKQLVFGRIAMQA